jgi:TATA-box binding protein (TBP) (component of TFIID and TFIIIB)
MDIKNAFFTPYKVSTITFNANISKQVIKLNPEILFNNIRIENKIKSFVWIQCLNKTEEKSRGIFPKKKRNTKKNKEKKNRFDNQITSYYYYDKDYLPNIKIFKNGNLHMTGMRSEEDAVYIVNSIIEEIKYIYEIDNNIINCPLECLEIDNPIVRMINTDFKAYTSPDMTEKYCIRRKKLHLLLISDLYNNKSSFQPGTYHGVKLDYYWNPNKEINDGICNCVNHCIGKEKNKKSECKKITIPIFESGSILITGGVSFKQIDDAYNYITNILEKHYDEIKKNILVIPNE